jgi:hypothetical protein
VEKVRALPAAAHPLAHGVALQTGTRESRWLRIR